MRDRLSVIVGGILYIYLLIWCYVNIDVFSFAYNGFINNNPPLFNVFLHSLISLVPILWLPLSPSKPSDVAYLLLYIQVFVPMSLMPLFVLTKPPEEVLIFSLSMLVAFFVLYRMGRLRRRELKRPRLRQRSFWLLVSGLFVVSTVLIISAFGLHFHWLALADVYDTRAAWDTQLQTSGLFGRIAGYAVEWQAATIDPLIMIYGAVYRKKLPLIAGLAGQFIIYTLTGLKTALFFPLALVLFLVALRFFSRHFTGVFIWAAAATMVFCFLAFRVSHSVFFFLVVPHRLLIAPGVLSSYYFEYFSKNPLLFYSQLSGIRLMVHAPYTQRAAFLISEYYLHAPGGDANVNLWADGYSNLGYVGIFVSTLLLGGFFWLYDCLAVRRSWIIACLGLVMPSIELANVGIFTAVTTHGIGLLLVLFWLMPSLDERG